MYAVYGPDSIKLLHWRSADWTGNPAQGTTHDIVGRAQGHCIPIIILLSLVAAAGTHVMCPLMACHSFTT